MCSGESSRLLPRRSAPGTPPGKTAGGVLGSGGSRRSAKLWLAGIGLWCLLLSTGCGHAARPVYLRGDSEMVKLRAGEPAPRPGWLISDQALVDLIECCAACQE